MAAGAVLLAGVVAVAGMPSHNRLQIVSTEKAQWKRLCEQGQLFAIVDSCDEPRVRKKVKELGPERAISLYRGGAEQQYSKVAPYLVQVDPPLFDWIEGELWPSPWGIFVYAQASLESLRTHFRHFLTVKGMDQKKYLLRFYDPRVLPAFLESCSEGELAQFFGLVQGYGAKKDDTVALLRRQVP